MMKEKSRDCLVPEAEMTSTELFSTKFSDRKHKDKTLRMYIYECL